MPMFTNEETERREAPFLLKKLPATTQEGQVFNPGGPGLGELPFWTQRWRPHGGHISVYVCLGRKIRLF